jgi:hypothetical protein
MIFFFWALVIAHYIKKKKKNADVHYIESNFYYMENKYTIDKIYNFNLSCDKHSKTI